VAGATAWLSERAGGLSPGRISVAVRDVYREDTTFSAPILAMCALAGRLGEGSAAWGQVPPLPFEWAVVPRRLLRWLRVGVVSYALPALIAVGLARHRLAESTGRVEAADILRGACRAVRGRVRQRVVPRALQLLGEIQPTNGGFLEAAPLTGFVVMCLKGAGYGDHTVVGRGTRFLAGAARSDGSWPIDTDLATWLTTASVAALGEEGLVYLRAEQVSAVRRWLMSQWVDLRHPYTCAPPGGWGWTDLPGSVPDADDTAGALLALRRLGPPDEPCGRCVGAGVEWLLGMQNRDGGVPTFCRGWGRLPFDRSSAEVTSHALRAVDEWYDAFGAAQRGRIDGFMQGAMNYLASEQRPDGSWLPLWFGNQQAPGKKSPVYGTARVVAGLRALTPGRLPHRDELVTRGRAWLVAAQNPDGGWGGSGGVRSSIEETAVAVVALAGMDGGGAVARGVAWIVEHTEGGNRFPASPIGLYFASLWYSERLYPVIFTVEALRAVANAGPPGGRGQTNAGC